MNLAGAHNNSKSGVPRRQGQSSLEELNVSSLKAPDLQKRHYHV